MQAARYCMPPSITKLQLRLMTNNVVPYVQIHHDLQVILRPSNQLEAYSCMITPNIVAQVFNLIKLRST